MTLRLDIDSQERRRRVCTPEEQREFATLGRQLLAHDVSLEEIQAALGYEGIEGVQRALDFSRVTTERLEQLRELAARRLGTGTSDDVRRKPAGPKVWTPPASLGGTPAARPTAPAPGAEGDAPAGTDPSKEGESLTKAQHRRFRDHVDRLRAVDARFRGWSLIARACGMSSGQIAQRAYEVGTSLSTLRNLETFGRLHAAFGSRATVALMEDVPVTELQDHLMTKAEAEALAVTEEKGRMAEDTEVAVEREESAEAEAPAGGARKRRRRRKKVHLDAAQHRKLREVVEGLWERDPKLRNWTLLARAAGLSTGPAMKRAYEVNSSTTTLANLSGFARAHARHGSAAVAALRSGVETEALEAHLQGSAAQGPAEASVSRPPAEADAPSSRTGSAAPPEPRPEASDAAPPAVDFSRLLELGHRIDAEVQHLWRASRLFEDLARQPSLPPMIRANAGIARDHLRSVIGLFAGGEGSGE